MENVTCIICGEKKFSHYLDVQCKNTKEFFTLQQCSCSLIMTSPRPFYKKIEKYYENDYIPHARVNQKEYYSNKIFKKISYSWKLKLIKRFGFSKGDLKVIDIGGGDGSLANHLNGKENGHGKIIVDVYEKNRDCVDYINSNNIFATDSFEEIKDKQYDVLTLWHSLEHIHDTDNLFRNMNKISSDDAIMILAVPNALAAEIYFLSNQWIAWDVPKHLYHFTSNSLGLLLKKHNWEVVSSKGMIQDTLFNIYMSLDGYFIKKIIICLFIFIYSLIMQILFIKKRSTNLVICRKK